MRTASNSYRFNKITGDIEHLKQKVADFNNYLHQQLLPEVFSSACFHTKSRAVQVAFENKVSHCNTMISNIERLLDRKPKINITVLSRNIKMHTSKVNKSFSTFGETIDEIVKPSLRLNIPETISK
jgi:t-SNARE complex subunit (syntaxin)